MCAHVRKFSKDQPARKSYYISFVQKRELKEKFTFSGVQNENSCRDSYLLHIQSVERKCMSAPRFRVDPLSEYFVKLVDIIFGLTITQSFLLYKETILSPTFSVETLSLILVYFTIVLSWIGYHKSILYYPYNKSSWSRFRLLLDILILLLYTYLVFVGQDLTKVLLGLVAVFIVYLINGACRVLEWHDGKVSKYWLSALFAFFFGLEWYTSLYFEWEYLAWSLLIIAFILLFGYRLIRGRLGYPPLHVIGVDVDGVLAEQVPHALQRLQKEGKAKNLTKDSITDWCFQFEGTDISKEIEKALRDPVFIREMPVVQGSTAVMEELYRKYHLVIATSRPKITEEDTKKWIRKNYNFHEFVNTREIGKDKLGLDVLIDDNLENAEDFASSGGYVLLLSQPWNEKTQSQKIDKFIRTEKIVRCKDWNDVPKALENIINILRKRS